MRSWKTPTADQVDKAVALLTHIERQRYFFSRLENPEWVEPLWRKGYFKQPPDPRPDEETATVLFSSWPESQYLARMARHKPELVRDIIAKMPHTENPVVLKDLAAALTEMPPDVAADLADKARGWARSPYVDTRVLPHKLAAVAEHLAKGGHTSEALGIAEALLETMPDPNLSREAPAGDHRRTAQSVSRINAGDYQEIIARCVPALSRAAGVPALEMLCHRLEEAVRLSRSPSGREQSQDSSYIWRPAVEDHAQNWTEDVRSALVSAVRDSAELLVAANRAGVQEIVALLEQRPYKMFHRIALHLLARFPDEAPELVCSRLTDRALFDDPGVRHEYARLMGACFGLLSQEDRETILGWIEAGPDLQQGAASVEQETDESHTEEFLARRRELWQRDRLFWIERYLPEDWKAHYACLIEKHGKPEHTEFPFYFGGVAWVGPASPKSEEELENMSEEQVVSLLRRWHPPASVLREPSPEGLGRVLANVVAREPERFAAQARAFRDLDPTYVRSLLEGLEKAIKEGHAIDWGSVLELCRWVVDQPREISGREPDTGDRDPSWGRCRGAVASLLTAGLGTTTGGLPFERREDLWGILLTLTHDPEPSPEYEAEYGGSNLDPATLSINTVRGEAMHAVVEYALWVRRNLDEQLGTDEPAGRGFQDMPEVREVLGEHLDTARDASVAVRSVYGQRLAQLFVLDSGWLRENVDLIFPLGEDAGGYFDAAWESYLAFHRRSVEGLNLLRDQYTRAVSSIARTRDNRSTVGSPAERLAEHLMVFYWKGGLELSDPLLQRFWENAPDNLRCHALSFAGWFLERTEGEVPQNVLSRLEELWRARLSAAQGDTAAGPYREELAAFGSWFVSGRFDDDWAIAQLKRALTLAAKAEPAHRVANRLAEVPDTCLREAVECLRLMARGDREGWGIFSWREQVRTVLARALSHPAARPEAEDLVHYLGNRGFFEFQELLP